MTKDEAFLEWYNNAHWGNEDLKECCHRSWNAAIKQARSAPVQEPVAWMVDVDLANYQGQSEYRTILAWNSKPVWSGTHEINEVLKSVPLYTTPPAAQPAPVPENFIDALKFDVAMRDAASAQEPVAIVSGYYGGQCVILPVNPSRIFNSGTAFYTTPPAAPVQEPVIDHSCKDIYELIMKWADIYAAQTGNLYAQAAQDPSKVARMADERTMLACVVAQAISQPPEPDLLSALKRILDEPNNTMSDGKALKEIIRIARRAITKATGEKT